MSQPTEYTPQHSFVADSATVPNFPGQAIDVELNAVKATTDQVRANLALIQRDDGALFNGVVTYDSLSASLQTNGIAGAVAWLTGVDYAIGSPVIANGNLYRGAVAHTSGVFAADLAAGKWSFVIRLFNSVDPKQFGGVGDGAADDTAAINAAAAAQAAAGGGVVDLSDGRWLIDSADLNVPKSVQLYGGNLSFGRQGTTAQGASWTTCNGTLIVNPSYTVRLTGRSAQLSGLVIVRKGTTPPSTIREAYDAIAAFSGTAVTFASAATPGNADDGYVGHCFIIGFAQAIFNDFNKRSKIEYVSGDCTAGIKLSRSFDMQHMVNCHFWPYLTAHITPPAYAVSGAADNGSGLIRLAVSSTATMATGDVDNVVNVGGTTEANGRWTIAVIDGTHIDLQGSTFINAYTSGGSVIMNSFRRTGAAYWFDGTTGTVDWGQAEGCFSYGYDAGFKIDSSDHATFVNCGADNYATAKDQTTVGWDIRGTSGATALVGCKGAAQGKNYRFASSATAEKSISLTSCRSWGASRYSYSFEDGNVSLIGCAGTGIMRIETNAEDISIIGGDFTGATYETATGGIIPNHLNVAGFLPRSRIVDNTNSASVRASSVENHRTTPAANDTFFESKFTTDSAGTQIEIARSSYRATSVTAGAVTSQMFWGVQNAGSFLDYLQLIPGFFRPAANDLAALGSGLQSWSDLFLASGGVINFANGDVTLTHGTDSVTIAGGKILFAPTAAGFASFNLPAGTAPTSPADGDVWREDNTNTGLKIRINGVTKTVTLS